MGEEAKLSVAVKKTQEGLGKFLKKPPLTEKLLKKPPFRFLHDVISAVIKQHGLMEGLFTAEELVSDNVKDKELKVIFLQKVIDTIKIVTGTNLTVKPSKIVAGQEAEKTNELLQAMAIALEKKLDSSNAVQEVTGSSKVINGDSKVGSKTRQKKETTVNGKSPPRKREGSKEDKQRTEKPKHRDVSNLSKDDPKQSSPKKSKEGGTRLKAQKAKEPAAAEAKPVLKEPAQKEPENFVPSAPELSPKEPAPESPKKETTPKRKASAAPKEVVEGLDETTPVFGATMQDPKPTNSRQEPNDQQQGSVVMPPRPASTRPSSAKPRPLTARPAAPRLKERIVKPAVDEPETTQEQNSTPETTFVSKADDDEDKDFVVEEAPAEPEENEPKNVMTASEIAAMADSEQPHGHLVTQILGTKRELEISKEETVPEDQEGQWQGRDVVRQEMSRLREGLQGVVRAVNPLARLLDFLQEDIESMQLELDQWSATASSTKSHLQAEKRFTEETLAPLQVQLSELDKKLEHQEQLNTVLRTNILLNDQKMWQRLSH